MVKYKDNQANVKNTSIKVHTTTVVQVGVLEGMQPCNDHKMHRTDIMQQPNLLVLVLHCVWHSVIPSSIYSWYIGHILEHEFFCLG